jgi:hypothetical protein
MKTIIKNKSNLKFLKTSVETLDRSHKPIPNQEVIRLYREVIQMTRRFTWANEDGEPWQDILRKTARAEFDELRTETDSVKVGKFLITWRDSLRQIHNKINKAQLEMMKHVDESRTDRANPNQNNYADEILKH